MDPAAIIPARHKLDADRYFQMAEAGVLGEDDKVELIEGDLIDTAPAGQDHGGYVSGLMQALYSACAGRATVWTQSSLWLNQHAVPEPDFAVLRWRADYYATGARPGPADILLLVEVARTSLQFDRTVKLPLYAEAAIPEAWIVDVGRGVIEVHRTPIGSAYGETQIYQPGEPITLAAAPGLVVTLDPVFAAR